MSLSEPVLKLCSAVISAFVCCYQVGKAEVQRLVREMSAEEGRHKRALEDLRQQCGREAEDAHREYFSQCKASQSAQCTETLVHFQ